MNQILEDMKQAAKAASKIIMENFGNVDVEFKADNSQVTKVDKDCELLIKKILGEKYPDYGFLGEEFGTTKKAQYMFVIDPLDGTANYISKVPFFCTSIALFKDDHPIAGVIYAPILDELFYTVKGKGAFLNGKRIHVNKIDDLKKGMIGYCHIPKEFDETIPRLIALKRINSRTRQYGASALELAYVAAGRFIGEIGAACRWDHGAGVLLVTEAGGKATDFIGNPFTFKSKFILATNGLIHEELRNMK